MFVIKVGDYYVKSVEATFGGYVSEIVLSKEIKRGFTKAGAERIAKMINGIVIEMTEEVTND